MEQQSLCQELCLVPVPPVLFLGSLAAAAEPPSGVVQGTCWKLLSSWPRSQSSQAGHHAFLCGSIRISARLETVLGHLAAGSPWLEASGWVL